MESFIIVIAHQKGGVGKSTIAANLLEELGGSVAALDLDAQRSLTLFNNKRQNKLDVRQVDTPEQLKKEVNANQGIMLIDAAGIDSDINRLALMAADLLITPVSDSEIELYGLMNFRRILEEIRTVRPDLRARILLNRVHPNAKNSTVKIREFVDQAEEFEIFDTILRDRSDFKRCFAAGRGVTALNAAGAAAAEIKELMKEVKTCQS